MRIYFLFYFLLAYSQLLQAQEALNGKILDEYGEPIPFANVYSKKTRSGTVSNVEGKFKLYIKSVSNDTLIVSHIGFANFYLPLNDHNKERYNEITLREDVISLEEITISPIKFLKNPKQIVREAVSKIASTSNHQPFILKGYYRHVDTQDGKYKRLIEAAVVINDSGYGDDTSPTIGIEQLRRSVDQRVNYEAPSGSNDLLKERDLKYKTNQLDCWYRNNFRRTGSSDLNKYGNSPCGSFDYGILDESFIKEHKFKLDTMATYSDDFVYVIKILPSLASKSYGVMPRSAIVPIGKLYIRASDFALLKMDYYYILNPKKSRTQDFRIYQNIMGSRIMFQISALYKEYNGAIYLSYLSTKHYFAAGNEDRKERGSDGQRVYNLLERELLINEIIVDSGAVKSVVDNWEWDGQLFSENRLYDESFWINYNVLLETSSQEKFRKDLEKKISLEEQFKKSSH